MPPFLRKNYTPDDITNQEFKPNYTSIYNHAQHIACLIVAGTIAYSGFQEETEITRSISFFIIYLGLLCITS